MRTILFVIVSAGAALLAGCGARQAETHAASGPPAVIAPVMTVGRETFLITVPVTGTLVSNSRVDVKAEVIGRIVRFDREEGDRVAAGDPVIWVNDESYRLAQRQAETALQFAEVSLERARLLASHGRTELERANNLLKSGGITDKDLKAAQLAEQDARAQVLIAEAQRDQSQRILGYGPEERARYRGSFAGLRRDPEEIRQQGRLRGSGHAGFHSGGQQPPGTGEPGCIGGLGVHPWRPARHVHREQLSGPAIRRPSGGDRPGRGHRHAVGQSANSGARTWTDN